MNYQRLLLCQKLAAKIVAKYRAECPEGCDPQNTYFAAGTAIVTAGVGIWKSYQEKKNADKLAGAMDFGATDRLKEALSASDKDLYGEKFVPEEYESRVGTGESYAKRVAPEAMENIEGSLPGLFDMTSRINKRNMAAANAATGDRFGAVMKNQGQAINAMIKGKVNPDVVKSVNKLVAEHLGGAVNPAALAGGFDLTSTASDLAEKLGITSLDMSKSGLTFASEWQKNVQNFLYRPEQAAKDFLFPMMSAGIASSKLQEELDVSDYYGKINKGAAEAAPDPQARGKLNDALTMLALQTQAGSNAAAAQAGLINSVGSGVQAVGNLGQQVAGRNVAQAPYGGSYEGRAGEVMGVPANSTTFNPYAPVYRPATA